MRPVESKTPAMGVSVAGVAFCGPGGTRAADLQSWSVLQTIAAKSSV